MAVLFERPVSGRDAAYKSVHAHRPDARPRRGPLAKTNDYLALARRRGRSGARRSVVHARSAPRRRGLRRARARRRRATWTRRGTARRRSTDGNVEVDAERDAIDFELFEEARRARTSRSLGICRGLQVVNVALGRHARAGHPEPSGRPGRRTRRTSEAEGQAPRPRGARSRRARGSPAIAGGAGDRGQQPPSPGDRAARAGAAVSARRARRRARGGRGDGANRGSSPCSGIRRTSRAATPVSAGIFAEFVRAVRRSAADGHP